MNPILLVDDDSDDLLLIQTAMRDLDIERPIRYFESGQAMIRYLRESDDSPFLIICDVNLPSDNGFTVKKIITEDPDLKYKSVPFIFWSTHASEVEIKQAYDLPAQGFFLKPSNFDELRETLKMIIGYWQKSQHPKHVS